MKKVPHAARPACGTGLEIFGSADMFCQSDYCPQSLAVSLVIVQVALSPQLTTVEEKHPS
jgi:hypothetical protein